jgi:hypothetical protein
MAIGIDEGTVTVIEDDPARGMAMPVSAMPAVRWFGECPEGPSMATLSTDADENDEPPSTRQTGMDSCEDGEDGENFSAFPNAPPASSSVLSDSADGTRKDLCSTNCGIPSLVQLV